MRVLELCSGIGGLGVGLARAVAGARTVCHVEREAFAASVLVARMEDATLDPAPVWDDLATFDARPWRGAVDCVAAGFPCQPFSVAGSRRGAEDDRHLWPHIARIVRDVGPGFVFLENVPGLLSVSGGAVFGAVLADLAALGLDAEWEVLPASAVGAPHRRERLFLLAWRVSDAGGGELRTEPGREQPGGPGAPGARDVGTEPVGDADESRREGRGLPGLAGPNEPPARPRGGSLADADGGGCEQLRSGRIRPLLGSPRGDDTHGRHRWPPGPGDEAGWRDWVARCGPLPAVRRDADGLSARVDRLRALGNAVVPQQAALAFRVLAERAGLA